MKKILGYFCIVCLVFSCNKTEEKAISESLETEGIVYDMYVPSEMSKLMNQMYAYNADIKKAIVSGEDIQEFPSFFLNIYTAELSNFKVRNETFESFSKLFIEAQKELYNPDSEFSQTQRFNNVVNLCISCHQTECSGPIRRIKKLLIK